MSFSVGYLLEDFFKFYFLLPYPDREGKEKLLTSAFRPISRKRAW